MLKKLMPRSKKVKDTIATLAKQLRELQAQQAASAEESAANTKKLDLILYQIGEKSARLALGKADPDG